MVPEETGEVANEWHTKYLARHKALKRDTRDMPGAWARWVAGEVGLQPLAKAKREQIVRIRDALTRAFENEEMSAKRTLNIWSDVVKAPFGRAFSDDDPSYSSVRVGPASAKPALGVKPPVTKKQLEESKRERQPMFPREFMKIMTCAAIPIAARRIYALAVFLYIRPEELYALRWSDVDWEASEIRIRRTLHVRTGEEVEETKSSAGRREIPIHKNLMPLLVAMHRGVTNQSVRVLPILLRPGSSLPASARAYEDFADQTRKRMRIAGLERSELIDGSTNLMPFDFRSWRTTGCTWLAMLGTDSYVITKQAGHKSPDVTWNSYIKRGPDLRRRYGEPFPELPIELIEASPRSGRGFGFGPKRLSDSKTLQRRGRDSNPRSAFDGRPLSKRVPSATRSPLLSGKHRSTAALPAWQLPQERFDRERRPPGQLDRGEAHGVRAEASLAQGHLALLRGAREVAPHAAVLEDQLQRVAVHRHRRVDLLAADAEDLDAGLHGERAGDDREPYVETADEAARVGGPAVHLDRHERVVHEEPRRGEDDAHPRAGRRGGGVHR